MKHGNNDYARFVCMIEERVRKPMNQNSTKRSVHDLERQWPSLRQSNGFVDTTYELT